MWNNCVVDGHTIDIAIRDDGTIVTVGQATGTADEIAMELCNALGRVLGCEFSTIGLRVETVLEDHVALVSISERTPRATYVLSGVSSHHDAKAAVVEAVMRAIFEEAGIRNALGAGVLRLVRDGDVEAAIVTVSGRPRQEFGHAGDNARLEQLVKIVPAVGRLSVQTVVRPYRVLNTGGAVVALAVADRSNAPERVDRWLDDVLTSTDLRDRARMNQL
jgi:hypothetical protein